MIRLRPHRIDQRDLQGNVLCGYGNDYADALYAFVRAADAPSGRRWLGELAERVTSAVPWRKGREPESTLNLALSFDGLRALGVPERMLGTFPDEFKAGMASRAALLGDIGESAPEGWQPGLRQGEHHILVTITARSAELLSQARAELLARMEADGGLELVHEVRAALLDHPVEGAFGREHFGFADGLSQPAIKGNAGPYDHLGRGTPRGRRWEPLEPGEFVLGYRDAEGIVAGDVCDPLRRSGSFTVVRKLHQDVALFTRWLREAAGGEPGREAVLRAKILGRWPDGTPLAQSPHSPPDPPRTTDEYRQRAKTLNDFRYGDDPDGLICPLGAHARRANPRDALGWEGKLTRRHRIIRRGMPYGPRPADPAEADGEERGLMFVCHQASIGRQFEVIQARWLNDGEAMGLGDERDVLAASEDPRGRMTIQGEPPTYLSPLRSFVVLRGGSYLFTPGLEALRALAAGPS